MPSVQSTLLGQLTIGIIGIAILYRRWKEAKKESAVRIGSF
jgi:hypothetical protein